MSSTPLSTWQTNNTVWALAYAKGVVYVGGQFTSVRPPGDPLGKGEVHRTYLAAFNSSTGKLIKSFNPKITGTSASEIMALAVSPDGKTLYAGGVFDHVNGAARDNLAAFSTSTGALTRWAPNAFGKVLTIAPSPNGSEIYLGGAFNSLDGVADTYAGAVTAAGTGTLDPWRPNLNNAVTSIAIAPNDSRVIIGGYFTEFDGVTQNAIGSTDPATGVTSKPFAATIVPNYPGCSSSVKDVVIGSATKSNPAGVAYIAAEGTGAGCFDGDFAANVSNGSLVWQNTCLGATQALVIIRGWLYKGSHAHDCAYTPGGFPQVGTGTSEVAHHLLDQSLTDGTLGHWTPNTNATLLGPRAMATDGSHLFVGGDFTTVNRKGQQGFALFGPGPDTRTPSPPAAPIVSSTSKGVDSVTVTAVSTPDVGTLRYAIYRSGRRAPIATLTATSWPWALPVLHYRDAGLRPGSRYTYRVTVGDGTRTSAKSGASARVTVVSRNPPTSYPVAVTRSKPSFFWRLNQSSGSTATDSSPHHFSGIYEPGTAKGVPGPITGSKDKATSFNGVTGLVTSAHPVTAPQSFSIEGWFKSSTNTGGMLIGFGNAQTGLSTTYDRRIYMMNDGQLVFGVLTGTLATVESPDVYNDGHWHYVVATLSPTGQMALYVDGLRVGTTAGSPAQHLVGYWRVGGDNLAGLEPRSVGQQQPGHDRAVPLLLPRLDG